MANSAAASGSDASAAWVAAVRSSTDPAALQRISDLADGTAYRLRVRAKNGEGDGAWLFGTGTPGQAALSTNADLSGLTVSTSAGSGGPFNALAIGTFAASTTSYTASVLNTQTHLKLTPTVADTGKAAVGVRKGNQGSFTDVTSGSASAEIALDEGANEITVRVTAEDTTTTKDYTVTVTRLPAGTSWAATFTPVAVGGDPGCNGKSACDSALSDNSFTIGGTAFHFTFISNTAVTGAIQLEFSPNVNNALKALNFCSGSVSVPLTSASGNSLFIGGGYNMGWTVGSPSEIRFGSNCAVAQPPTAPTNLRVTPSNGGLNLAWTAPSEGILTGYHIEWKEQSAADQAATTADDPATGWVRHGAVPATNNISIPSLVNGTTYDLRIRGTSAAGNGILLHRDRVRARRHGGAGEDARGLAGPHRRGQRMAGGRAPGDRQQRRLGLAVEIGEGEGIAVDGGVVVRRHVAPGDERAGENAARGAPQCDRPPFARWRGRVRRSAPAPASVVIGASPAAKQSSPSWAMSDRAAGRRRRGGCPAPARNARR